MRKSSIALAARLGLSLFLLALLLALIDREALVEAFSNLHLGYYLVGLGLYGCSITLWAVRWRFFITASGDRASLWRAWSTILVGSFFSLFLPTIVGNDLARMYRLSPEGGTSSRIISTVLLDRVIGLVSLVLMALAAALVGYQFIGGSNNILLLMAVILAAFAAGWLLFFNRDIMRRFQWGLRLPLVNRVEGRIRALYAAMYHLHNRPALLLKTLGVSLLMQAVEVVGVIFMARALGVTVDPVYFFIFMPIIWVVTMIPVSASGLGVREGSFAFFFVQVGATSSEAVAISLLYYSARLVVGAAGGLLLLRAAVDPLRWQMSRQPVPDSLDPKGTELT